MTKEEALNAEAIEAGKIILQLIAGYHCTPLEGYGDKLPWALRDLDAAVRQMRRELNFQANVRKWVVACFGEEIADDLRERNHRFIEEALELVQSTGATREECLQLVDYVFNRPVGERAQEVGGVMVTLAALCSARPVHIDITPAAETELARIWTKIEAIRAKQAAKPKHSPLPKYSCPICHDKGHYSNQLSNGENTICDCPAGQKR